jgi:hypothetical protein
VILVMARIRTIKPEFWTSEQIVECSMSARLLFIGLWNFCDDNGVHPYTIKTIKMEVFPGDEIKLSTIENWMNELEKNGLIKTYHIDDKRYLLVTGWQHQKIDRPNPKHPLPIKFDDDSTNDHRYIDEQSPPEGKGRESNGKEGNIYSSDFLLFWSEYPKKSGSKKAAFDNWKKLNGNKPPIDIILKAIEKQKAWRLNAGPGDFRPEWKDPERWIKNRMWEAELSDDQPKHATQPSGVLSCPKCGKRVLKSDLIENGCVYCRLGEANEQNCAS